MSERWRALALGSKAEALRRCSSRLRFACMALIRFRMPLHCGAADVDLNIRKPPLQPARRASALAALRAARCWLMALSWLAALPALAPWLRCSEARRPSSRVQTLDAASAVAAPARRIMAVAKIRENTLSIRMELALGRVRCAGLPLVPRARRHSTDASDGHHHGRAFATKTSRRSASATRLMADIRIFGWLFGAGCD